jgi:cation diffusion facilitator family transporter
MPSPITTRRVVVMSLCVDVFDIGSNLLVALFTGSAVIFAEMAQGMADATGSVLLVIGYWRAQRPRSPKYPLGRGREVFFWVLCAALAMLVLGAGLSAWRGYHQVVAPQALGRMPLAFGILLVSIGTNGYAFSLSLRKLKEGGAPLLKAFATSRRPLVNASLVQDGLGTLSSVMGFVALVVCAVSGIAVFDGIGALVNAFLMVVCSLILVSQARHLIAGRSVPADLRQQILQSVMTIPEVEAVNKLTAVFSGARKVEVDCDLDVREDLTTGDIEALLDRIQARVRAFAGDGSTVRVDLNSPVPGAD